MGSQNGSSRRLLGRPYDRDWMDHARCQGIDDPDIFFPEMGHKTTKAKKMCIKCPVLILCREYAIDTEQEWGIWGGLDKHQRAAIIARRKRDEREGNSPVERGSRQLNVPGDRFEGTRIRLKGRHRVVITLWPKARNGTDTGAEGSIVLQRWHRTEATRLRHFRFGEFEPDWEPSDASRNLSGAYGR